MNNSSPLMRPAKLNGKVAIVTGAAQGAGFGSAMAMAKEGASVLLMGRTRAKLDTAAKAIKDAGGICDVHAGDVTKTADINATVAKAMASFGRIDVLVCAAQSPEVRSGMLAEISEDLMEELWRSGAMATLLFMRAVRPHMIAVGGGSIINFGSGSQHNPAHYGVYAGVKAAIQAISRAAAAEWGREGIRVNTVLPMVASPAATTQFNLTPGTEAAILQRSLVGRIGDPEKDIGRAIAFLASDESSYITGSTFSLDGGLTYLR